MERAAGKCLANYVFLIGATLECLPDLIAARPVCGIKIFMGSAHGDMVGESRGRIRANFYEEDRLIAVHAEDRARIVGCEKQYGGIADRAIRFTNKGEMESFWRMEPDGLARLYDCRGVRGHLNAASSILMFGAGRCDWAKLSGRARLASVELQDPERFTERQGVKLFLNAPLAIRSKSDLRRDERRESRKNS